ncbi:hypothetical protein BD413DRAFT_584498 [Trametes elegans]|nr:hypothetical protein BD413DRAFT_584498 [Trametes elegans]
MRHSCRSLPSGGVSIPSATPSPWNCQPHPNNHSQGEFQDRPHSRIAWPYSPAESLPTRHCRASSCRNRAMPAYAPLPQEPHRPDCDNKRQPRTPVALLLAALLAANVIALALAAHTLRALYRELETRLEAVDTRALPRPDPLYGLMKQTDVRADSTGTEGEARRTRAGECVPRTHDQARVPFK